MTATSRTDAFGPAPRDEPLDYPGTAPPASGLLTADGFRPAAALDQALQALDAAPLRSRLPVLAVGSNASPAQLHAKFRSAGVEPTAALTWATVTGVRVGVAATVSRWGYVPAAPVFDPAATSRLVVTWLDRAQLAAVDATEGGYQRRFLRRFDGAGPAARLPSGAPVPACGVYVSRTGVLAVAGDRLPLPLAPQPALIERILAAAGPAFADLTGGTVEGFVAAARDPDRRARLAAALGSSPGLRVVRAGDPTPPGSRARPSPRGA